MNSLLELLFDGWEIYCSNEYKYYKKYPCVPISVLGEGNSGKSFLLGKIFNIDFPNGFSQKTEGISYKYFQDCALIDTCGLRKPMKKNHIKNLIKEFLISELKQKKNENEEEIEKKIEEIKNKEINIDDIKSKNEKLFYRCFKKIISDKQITEQFLIDFAFRCSKIVLIVVGQMTINVQLFINNLKKNVHDNKEIIVIHNLYNFVKKSQVENYIKDILKKSIYFNLQEIIYKETKKDFNKTFFIEKIENSNFVIKHLIFANDSKESEAGNYYNYSTIKYLRNIFFSFSYFRTFDVIEELKNFLFDYFKKENHLYKIKYENILMTEKNNEIKKESETEKTFIMKIKENSNFQLLSNILHYDNFFRFRKCIFYSSLFIL